ncbi:unnamed protein product [Echinostoma caproni]|uniref:WD_REPEATS_REGION domain-containing protein n=1 Tax=Echinostoma caproni TaxID=27848 RepID=A0A183A9Y1_9TREM|nr:unnamed protein product [Echinostoma caproni]
MAHIYDPQTGVLTASLDIESLKEELDSSTAVSEQEMARDDNPQCNTGKKDNRDRTPCIGDSACDAENLLQFTCLPESNLCVIWKWNGQRLMIMDWTKMKPLGTSTVCDGRLLHLSVIGNQNALFSLEYTSGEERTTQNEATKHNLDSRSSASQIQLSMFLRSWSIHFTKTTLLPGTRTPLFTVHEQIRLYDNLREEDRHNYCRSQIIRPFEQHKNRLCIELDDSRQCDFLFAWKYEAARGTMMQCAPLFDSDLQKPLCTRDVVAREEKELVRGLSHVHWLHDYPISAALLLQRLQLSVTADVNGIIKLWDTEFRPVAKLPHHTCRITHLLAHPLMHATEQDAVGADRNRFLGFLSIDSGGTLKSWEYKHWKSLASTVWQNTNLEEPNSLTIDETDSVQLFTRGPRENITASDRANGSTLARLFALWTVRDQICFILQPRPKRLNGNCDYILETWKAKQRGLLWGHSESGLALDYGKVIHPQKIGNNSINLKIDPEHNRLITTSSSGLVKFWKEIRPIPLIPAKSIQQRQNVHFMHRWIFSRFPFEAIQQINLFCLYTTPLVSPNSTKHSAFCVDTDLMASDRQFTPYRIDACVWREPAGRREQLRSVYSADVSKMGLETSVALSERLAQLRRLFVTISKDAMGTDRLEIWQWDYATSTTVTRHETLNNDTRRDLFLRPVIMENPQCPEPAQIGPVPQLSCRLNLVNTFRLPPFQFGANETEKAICLTFLNGTDTVVLAFEERVFLLPVDNLIPGYNVFRSRLSTLIQPEPCKVKGLIESSINDSINQNSALISTRTWDEELLRQMDYESLRLINSVQKQYLPSSIRYRLDVLHSQLEQSRGISLRIKRQQDDLDRLMSSSVSAKESCSKANVKRIKEEAFSAYFKKLLTEYELKAFQLRAQSPDKCSGKSRQLDTTTTHSVNSNNNNTSTVTEQPSGGQDKSQRRSRRHVGKRVLPSRLLPPIKRKQENAVEAANETSSDMTVAEANSEWGVLPLYRAHGFFPANMLDQTGRWTCGWAPNSVLIQHLCPEKYPVPQSATERVQWKLPDLISLKEKCRLASLTESDTLETSDSFIVPSPTPIDEILLAEEEEEGEDELELERQIQDRYLARSHQDSYKEVELETRNETASEPVTPVPKLKEPRLPTPKGRPIKFDLPETDLLSRLSADPEPPVRLLKRENTIFLTELNEELTTNVPKRRPTKPLPDYLLSYAESRWIEATGFWPTDEFGEHQWTGQKYDSDPIAFVCWILDSDLFDKILTHQIPPCPTDETPLMAQTAVELCTAIGSFHVQYGLPNALLKRIHQSVCTLLLTTRFIELFTLLPSWSLLWATSRLLLNLGYRDQCTIALFLTTYFALEAQRSFREQFVSEKQMLIVSTFEQLGLLDPSNELVHELAALFRGKHPKRFDGKQMDSQLTDTEQTGLQNWLVEGSAGEQFWLHAVELARTWLEHWCAIWATKRETSKMPNKRFAKRSVPIGPTLADSTKSSARSRHVKWSRASDQATYRPESGTPFQQSPDVIEAINTFCRATRAWNGRVQLSTAETTQVDDKIETEVVKISSVRGIPASTDQLEVSRVICLKDRTRPPCDQPWNAYRRALEGQFPPVVALRLPKHNLIPFWEAESKSELLWRRLREILFWKRFILDKTRQERNDYVNRTSVHPNGFERMLTEQQIRYYEKNLRLQIVRTSEEYRLQFMKTFIPALSRILSPVASWHLPQLTSSYTPQSTMIPRHHVTFAFDNSLSFAETDSVWKDQSA